MHCMPLSCECHSKGLGSWNTTAAWASHCVDRLLLAVAGSLGESASLHSLFEWMCEPKVTVWKNMWALVQGAQCLCHGAQSSPSCSGQGKMHLQLQVAGRHPSSISATRILWAHCNQLHLCLHSCVTYRGVNSRITLLYCIGTNADPVYIEFCNFDTSLQHRNSVAWEQKQHQHIQDMLGTMGHLEVRVGLHNHSFLQQEP